MSRKMFVSDLDGTLLTSDKTIPKSCIDTINKVQQNGDIFVIASGRSWPELSEFYTTLKLKTPCITNNGARMNNPNVKHFITNTKSISNEIFYKLWNNTELARQIEYFVIKTFDHNYTNKIPTEKNLRDIFSQTFYINFGNKKNYSKDILLKTKDRHTDPLAIILVLKKDHNFSSVIREIKNITNSLYVTRWEIKYSKVSPYENIIELNNKSANKLTAIQEIQNYYDVADEDLYFFGDGENDARALSYFHNSIAVSNASYAALVNAHHISRYTNNDGAVGKEIDNIMSWRK